MKICRRFSLAAILEILFFVFFILACNKETVEPSGEPKDQSATIINLFGNELSATVNGYFSDKEWGSGAVGIAAKVEFALKGSYPIRGDIIQNILNGLFRRGVTIVVEKTTEYDYWKTVGDGKTLYMNLKILDLEKRALHEEIQAAIWSLATDESTNSEDNKKPM